MFQQAKDNPGDYTFSVKNHTYQVFFADDDDLIEVCDIRKPGTTGFFFGDLKHLTLFINHLSDIREDRMELMKADTER